MGIFNKPKMEKEIITLREFNKIPDGEIFAKGILPNSPEGIYMTDNSPGVNLKWLAIKGYANDFAIYCHWFYFTDEYVADHGQKMTSKENILKCLPCDEELIKLYRL
jgi:hypothetical protein